MAGDGGAVVSANKEKVDAIKSWLPGSDLEEAIMDLAEAEHNFDQAKKYLSASKKKVAKAMKQ